MARYCFVSMLLAAALIGCAHTRPAAPVAAPFGPLVEGSDSAHGLLDFVNDHGHEQELLDRVIGLDSRAAQSITNHRLGPDADLGTEDDAYFLTLAELDDAAFVGPASMEKLAGYAAAQGYMHRHERVVGSFEGVSFTFVEAERTLALVNDASVRVLDEHVSLDSRAVRSITQARPLRSLEQLSELYYVGPAALARLKGHAVNRTVASR
jgi:hypothetical protein